MTPTIGTNVLVYEVANRFGFYRDEGFTIELIRTPLSTSIQAILGGSAALNYGVSEAGTPEQP